MTIDELKQSMTADTPPAGLSIPLTGLWLAAKGRWEDAHATVQDDSSRESAWVHAHLHKQEGDLANARYWYSRARRDTSGLGLDAEWEYIVGTLLKER